METATNTSKAKAIIAAILIAASFATGNGIQTLTTIGAPAAIAIDGGTK